LAATASELELDDGLVSGCRLRFLSWMSRKWS